MATFSQAHITGSESVSESDPASASVSPPISHRKQAAVLCSAFMTIALTIGYNQCFGVFQEYYLSDTQDVLTSSPASQDPPPTALLAFVGTLCYGLTWAGGIFVNPIISRIEHGSWTSTALVVGRRRKVLRLLTSRTITIFGVFTVSGGFLLASFSNSIWQLLLTQGFLVGFGMSFLYFPLLAPAPEYFTNHRATAMGFILAGGGTGGLILSPVIRTLLSSIGGRWTLRLYAGFNFIAGLPIAWTVPRSQFATRTSTSNGLERRSTHISRALALRSTFLFSAAAAFLQAAGAQLPLSFIPSYTVMLGLSASKGSNLLAASNAINAVSRVLTGYAGDRLGRQNTLILTLVVAASSVFALWLSSVLINASSSFSLWIAFIVLYSFSAGGYYALFPALIAEVFGIRQYAAVNAFILFVRGLGTVFGSPVGGQLLGSPQEGTKAYANIVCWDGSLLVGAMVCCVGIRWTHAKGMGWKWIA